MGRRVESGQQVICDGGDEDSRFWLKLFNDAPIHYSKTMMKRILLLFLGCCACSMAAMWNNPHSLQTSANVKHTSFSGAPKTLDPARAYSSDELQFIAQIYEPLLQYHYLKRPYVLQPLLAERIPKVTYYDGQGNVLPASTPVKDIAYSLYDVWIKPNVSYERHPALARRANGQRVYRIIDPAMLANVHQLSDFTERGTRVVRAADFVYEMKRLASPQVASPIFGLMSQHIVGLGELNKELVAAWQQRKNKQQWLDLRQYPLRGVTVLSPLHFQIKVKGVYPQFKYWLAMPFFAPIPWEADQFYHQPGMKARNLTFDWYPIGTGPYYLSLNDPNQMMKLTRNPLFRGERYPSEGEPGDKEKGYLDRQQQMMPFVDEYVFSLDKESIPRWNKFLQGYYDSSGISHDSFDQAVSMTASGEPNLTPEMAAKGIRLQTSVYPAVYYIGFNMQDDVVGGLSTRAKQLRQAISIAIDYEEYISIFMNGRGIAAQSPVPPGIFGYRAGRAGVNKIVYFWDGHQAKRQPIDRAKHLLTQAGYPNGIDSTTGKPLVLNYDVTTSGGADDKARYNWMRKQFSKLGITLNIRSTQYNRFQDKVRRGNAQIFSWGWLADYPDPENFLFLLYGPHGKVKHGGENAANYANPAFDRLFERMKNMPSGPERQAVIDEMLAIVQEDAPWIWGTHPISFTLTHQWNAPTKANAMANNTMKYQQIDPKQRKTQRQQWNQAVTWPIWLMVIGVGCVLLPLVWVYWRRERRPQVKRIAS